MVVVVVVVVVVDDDDDDDDDDDGAAASVAAASRELPISLFISHHLETTSCFGNTYVSELELTHLMNRTTSSTG